MRHPFPRVVSGLVALGMVVAASLWASEPIVADPPPLSWAPGQTVTTWDWERHWNYWMEWECASLSAKPGDGRQECFSWVPIGPTWKPCGPEVRPPQPGRTNTCNIGQPGGHRPHGDNTTERYTYLGRHEDRTGPTYAVCKDNPSLPADTSPGNCGTWMEIAHPHCVGDPSAHPPGCPSSDLVSTPRPSDPDQTTPSLPTEQPDSCASPRVARAFKEAVTEQPDPGHGLLPSSFGYVRVPIRAFYPYRTVVNFRIRVGNGAVDLRMWVAEVSWSFVGLGAIDGSDPGTRVFRRSVPHHGRAPTLNTPTAVEFGGREAVYLRSSRYGGYPDGYPIAVTVVWQGECLNGESSEAANLGNRTRRFGHSYRVYEIRSRPDQVELR